jgi:hypothetical protein
MGYWTTLHLFDDDIFYKKVVPALKEGKEELRADCLDFLKSHTTGGIYHLSELEINELVQQLINRISKIANSFDKTFKIHNEFQNIDKYDDRLHFLNALDGHYEFCNFFEYYVFKTCADFFPHLPLGKGGVFRNFNLSIKTLSYSIIGELDHTSEFFCSGLMGISNWMTSEDVELLYLDKYNLHFDTNSHAEGFLTLLEIAHQNKLGFIMGIDMREDTLEKLPANKLIRSDVWKKINPIGMLFER